ncbi:MAG: Mut7-C ubiquitin [Actinomycetota bacterium]|nr:Mut7-C ubiquitin [Actinomycetota bacterium]
MRVTIVCFGAMREFLPDPSSGRTELDLAPGGTVRDAVGALGAPERSIHSVLVEGLRTDLDQVLEEGAEVTLMPPFAGGSI